MKFEILGGLVGRMILSTGLAVTLGLALLVTIVTCRTMDAPSVDYETPGAGDYYLLAKRTNRSVVLEPYLYKVAGKDVLMTSLVTPIHDPAGVFLGVAGVDLPLSLLSEEIAKAEIGSDGYAALVSNSGLYVAHPKKERAGKPMKETDPWVEPVLGDIREGRGFEVESYSRTLNDNTFRIATPVDLGDSIPPWSVIVTLREGAVLASARQLRDLILLIGAGVLLVVLLTVWWIARGIVRPIRAISSELVEGSSQVAAASGQVSSSSQSLAEGASNQAASLEETSASLEELASMTKRNAEHAGQAKELATETRRTADVGAEDVREPGAPPVLAISGDERMLRAAARRGASDARAGVGPTVSLSARCRSRGRRRGAAW